jgi:hypothetical protein
LAEATASIADMLAPALNFLAEAISTPAGKWVAFGAIVLSLAPKIVAAVRAISAAFLSNPITAALVAIGLVVGAVAMFASAGESSGKAFVDTLAKEIRSGKKTLEKALEELAVDAAEKKRALMFQLKEAEMFNPVDPEQEDKLELLGLRREQIFKNQLARIQKEREDAERRLRFMSEGHQRVTPQVGGFEQTQESFRRIQQAVNKLEMTPQEKLTKEQLEVQKQMRDWLEWIAEGVKGLKPAVGR